MTIGSFGVYLLIPTFEIQSFDFWLVLLQRERR
jgi:hypothetical protein